MTRETQTDEFTRMLNVTDLNHPPLNQKLQRKRKFVAINNGVTTAKFRQKCRRASVTTLSLPSCANTQVNAGTRKCSRRGCQQAAEAMPGKRATDIANFIKNSSAQEQVRRRDTARIIMSLI
ncbi:MAG: hypothetical protein ABL996_08380 [Micropepsaceae bacterium]